MEANEAQELQEHAEHGSHESTLRPVAFTMSLLAVLVAVTTVLGHRTHTEAVLRPEQSHGPMERVSGPQDPFQRHGAGRRPAQRGHHRRQGRREKDRQVLCRSPGQVDREPERRKEKAEALETKVEQAEARANRFDLAEALLEIGLVITSVTLLTRRRAYWYLGIVFSLGGIASAVSVLLLK